MRNVHRRNAARKDSLRAAFQSLVKLAQTALRSRFVGRANATTRLRARLGGTVLYMS